MHATAALPALRRRALAIQVAVTGAVAAAVLLLWPCSPVALWGSCGSAAAIVPSTPAPADPPVAGAVDWQRDVVAASRTRPVLVDFNATWCGPCRILGPVLERLVESRKDIALVPIDVDANAAVAQAQGVEGIPDVRLWRDGKEVARFIGVRPQAEVAAWLDQHLAKP